MSEKDITANLMDNILLKKINEIAEKDNSEILPVSVNIEREISELEEKDKINVDTIKHFAPMVISSIECDSQHKKALRMNKLMKYPSQ